MDLFSAFKKKNKTFFRGGVHPDEHKDLTAQKAIEDLPTPREVSIHVSQHIGPAAKPIVKRKDTVKIGQVIAEAPDGGVPIHSPICGVIGSIAESPHSNLVRATSITIKHKDPEDGVDTVDFSENASWQSMETPQVLEKIKQAGLVGLGGAAFPTYRKLQVPDQFKIDTLIINGAECEPYLTSDHRLMLEQPYDIIWGAWILAKTVGVKKCLIGVEDNKIDAAEKLQHALKEIGPQQMSSPVDMRVEVVRTRYPQGSEKQLIQTLTGRNIQKGALPLHVGIVVQNVQTALSVYQAVRYNKPLIDRVFTVSGLGINTPKNIRVPLGTSLSEVVSFCGGMKDSVVKILSGGPMMGRAIGTLSMPVIKGTGGLLCLTPEETNLDSYQACVSCGECLAACPLGLEPNKISIFVEAGRPLETDTFGTSECFECGCCSYSCPSNRPLVQFIQVAKTAYRREWETQQKMHN